MGAADDVQIPHEHHPLIATKALERLSHLAKEGSLRSIFQRGRIA